MRDFLSCGVFKDVNKLRQNAAANESKTMNKTLLLAVAVGGVLTLAASARAGDTVMSPRAKAQADSLKTVPADSTADTIDRSLKSGSPKAIAQAGSQTVVSSTNQSLDLANAPRPTMSPKDPRYDTALRENAARQSEIQIAPLK